MSPSRAGALKQGQRVPGEGGLVAPVCLPACLYPTGPSCRHAILCRTRRHRWTSSLWNRARGEGCYLWLRTRQMELSHTEIAPISSARLAPRRRTAEASSQPAATSSPTSSCRGLWPVPAHQTWSQIGLGSSTACAAGNPRASLWASLRLRLSVCTIGLPRPPHRAVVRMA